MLLLRPLVLYLLLLEVEEQLHSHILLMATHGSHHLLVMLLLQVNVTHSLQMGYYGSLEVKEIIVWRIHPMESTGVRPLLGMRYFQTHVMRWDGMEQNGWLEAL
jgi:hypothetical protein